MDGPAAGAWRLACRWMTDVWPASYPGRAIRLKPLETMTQYTATFVSLSISLSLSQPWLQLAVAWWRPVRWPILIKTLLQAAASVADFYNNKHTCHSPSLQIWLSACLLISSNMACGVVLMVNCSLLGACLSRYQCERQTKTREWPMPARLRRVLVSQTTNAESRVTHMTGGDKRGQEEFSVVHQIWIL